GAGARRTVRLHGGGTASGRRPSGSVARVATRRRLGSAGSGTVRTPGAGTAGDHTGQGGRQGRETAQDAGGSETAQDIGGVRGVGAMGGSEDAEGNGGRCSSAPSRHAPNGPGRGARAPAAAGAAAPPADAAASDGGAGDAAMAAGVAERLPGDGAGHG